MTPTSIHRRVRGGCELLVPSGDGVEVDSTLYHPHSPPTAVVAAAAPGVHRWFPHQSCVSLVTPPRYGTTLAPHRRLSRRIQTESRRRCASTKSLHAACSQRGVAAHGPQCRRGCVGGGSTPETRTSAAAEAKAGHSRRNSAADVCVGSRVAVIVVISLLLWCCVGVGSVRLPTRLAVSRSDAATVVVVALSVACCRWCVGVVAVGMVVAGTAQRKIVGRQPQ